MQDTSSHTTPFIYAEKQTQLFFLIEIKSAKVNLIYIL